MFKLILIFIISTQILFGSYEYFDFNKEINSKLNLKEIETKKNNFEKDLEIKNIIKEKTHKKFGEDFFNSLKQIEKNVNKFVNNIMTPDALKEELKFKMEFKENADLNIEYIYSPKFYKNAKIKLQWEEDKLFLRYFYKYEFNGI